MNDKQLIITVGVNSYKRGKRYIFEKTISILKSKSHPGLVDCFENDYRNGEQLLIIGLDTCEPGTYQLKMINIQNDRETGLVDSWDWCLVPVVSSVLDSLPIIKSSLLNPSFFINKSDALKPNKSPVSLEDLSKRVENIEQQLKQLNQRTVHLTRLY